MSASSAALIRFRLAPASTSLPSIVSLGISRSLLCRRSFEWTTPELHMRFEFVAILRHEALHRHREAVGEHANRVALHVDGSVHHDLQIFHLAAASFEFGEQL